MNVEFRIFLLVCVAAYFLMLFFMIKKNKLGLKYALMWILCGLVMLMFVIFPQVVFKTSAMVGISNPVNAVFLLFAVLVTMLLISITSIISTLSDRNLRLAQSLALMEERIRRLEGKK